MNRPYVKIRWSVRESGVRATHETEVFLREMNRSVPFFAMIIVISIFGG